MKDHSCPCVYVCRYAYVNTCCNNALDVCSYKSIYILYHLILYYITLYTYTFAWVYMGQYIYTYTLIYFYVYIYIYIIYVRTYICIYTHTRKCVYRHSNLLCVSLGGSTFRDYATFSCCKLAAILGISFQPLVRMLSRPATRPMSSIRAGHNAQSYAGRRPADAVSEPSF